MSLPVKVGADARTDLDALDKALVAEAFAFMAKLRDAPRLGKELAEHPEVGDLSQCRKIYFDEARHRIIYRLTPNEKAPTAVEIIAIGPRADLKVYWDAISRVGRTPGIDTPQA